MIKIPSTTMSISSSAWMPFWLSRPWQQCLRVSALTVVIAALAGILIVVGMHGHRVDTAAATDHVTIQPGATLHLNLTRYARSQLTAAVAAATDGARVHVDAVVRAPDRVVAEHVTVAETLPAPLDGGVTCVKTAGLVFGWGTTWAAAGEWTVEWSSNGSSTFCVASDTCAAALAVGIDTVPPDLRTWPLLGCEPGRHVPVACQAALADNTAAAVVTINRCLETASVTAGIPCTGLARYLNASVTIGGATTAVSLPAVALDATGYVDLTVTASVVGRWLLAVTTNNDTVIVVNGTNELWPPAHGTLARTMLRVYAPSPATTVDVTVTPVATVGAGALVVHQITRMDACTRTGGDIPTLPLSLVNATVHGYATAASFAANMPTSRNVAGQWYVWVFPTAVGDANETDLRLEFQLSAAYRARILAVVGRACIETPVALSGHVRLAGMNSTRLTLLVSFVSADDLVGADTGTIGGNMTHRCTADTSVQPVDLPANSRGLFDRDAVWYYMQTSDSLHVRVTVYAHTEGLVAGVTLVGIAANGAAIGLASLVCCREDIVVLDAAHIAAHRFTEFQLYAVNGGHVHVHRATLQWEPVTTWVETVPVLPPVPPIPPNSTTHAVVRPTVDPGIVTTCTAAFVQFDNTTGYTLRRDVGRAMAAMCESPTEATAIATTVVPDDVRFVPFVPMIQYYATATTGTIVSSPGYAFASPALQFLDPDTVTTVTCAGGRETFVQTSTVYDAINGLVVASRLQTASITGDTVYGIPLFWTTVATVTSVSANMSCPFSNMYCGFRILHLTNISSGTGAVYWPPNVTAPTTVYWPRAGDITVTGLVWLQILENDTTLGAAIGNYTNTTTTVAQRQFALVLCRAVTATSRQALRSWTFEDVTRDTRVLARGDTVAWTDDVPTGLPPDPPPAS